MDDKAKRIGTSAVYALICLAGGAGLVRNASAIRTTHSLLPAVVLRVGQFVLVVGVMGAVLTAWLLARYWQERHR